MDNGNYSYSGYYVFAHVESMPDGSTGTLVLSVQPHKIMIVDSQTIMRDGLLALLSSEVNYDVVGTMSEGESAIDSIASLEPDIILMDLSLPGISGVETIALIKRQHAKIRIVALTFHNDDKYIYAALDAGADAYVLKDDSRSELFAAMSSVLEGKTYLSPGICDRVVAGYLAGTKDESEQAPWEILTPREREVIKLIAKGYKTKEIATQLSLSPKTIETHRSNLMRKLDLHNISAVTVYAIQNGIIDS